MRHAGGCLPPRIRPRGDDRWRDRLRGGRRPGAVEAVGATAGLDRRACRRVFEERFGASRMASDYLHVYRRLAGRLAVRPSVLLAGGSDCPPAGAPARRACSGRSGWQCRASEWDRDMRNQFSSPDPSTAIAGRPAPRAGPFRSDRRSDPRPQARGHVRRVRPLRPDQARRPGRGGPVPRRDPVPILPVAWSSTAGRPFFLGSTVRDENDQLSVSLTNPDESATAGSKSRSARYIWPSRRSCGGLPATGSCGSGTTGWHRRPRPSICASRPTSPTSTRFAV